jgi:hypothetical protein
MNFTSYLLLKLFNGQGIFNSALTFSHFGHAFVTRKGTSEGVEKQSALKVRVPQLQIGHLNCHAWGEISFYTSIALHRGLWIVYTLSHVCILLLQKKKSARKYRDRRDRGCENGCTRPPPSFAIFFWPHIWIKLMNFLCSLMYNTYFI